METKLIGTKIADVRRKNNLSQAQLAEQLFISPQAVGKWERGESIPDILTLNRLAKILGVDLNYFGEGIDPLATEPVEARVSAANTPTPDTGQKKSWDMSLGNWINADFSDLKNLHEKFSASNMKNCRFVGSDLTGLLLKSNNIDSCDFSDSLFNRVRVASSNLVKNKFIACSMQEAEFSKSFIADCDLSGADLSGTTFIAGGFQNNPVAGTRWNRTVFKSMYILNTTFEGDVEDCYFENCNFKKVIFKDVTLTHCFFKNNRGLKRVQFVDCKADRITFEFLKSGGADVKGITLTNTL